MINGGRWWTVAVLLSALVLTTCAVLRALGVPLAWLGGLIVWFVGVAWIFVPGTLYGIFPTPSSIGALHGLWLNGREIIGVESSPVAAAKPIVYVVATSFGFLAIILDVIVFNLRKPVLVGAVFTAMYVVPTAVTGHRPNVVLFLGIAALWLYLLRAEMRQRGGSILPETMAGATPTVIIALVALAVTLVLPTALPHVSNIAVAWGRPSQGVFERGINPILQLGQNLRRNNPVTALQFTTTSTETPYLKVANLLDFNGKSWRPSDEVRYGRSEGNVGLSRHIARTEVTTAITIKSLNSDRLPLPYPALEVAGLKGQWRWEPRGLTLKSDSANSTNQTYKVTSLQITPTRTQMQASRTVVGPSLRRYIALPDKMPTIIRKTALAVTAGTANDYDKAVALQNYYRDGIFAYSETAPVADGYDGNGVDVIADFLKVKRGYCVHFSSAMAVMARSLGIPARIAVGYAPGVEAGTTKTGKSVFEVTSNDLHAWPELYFGGVGWVQFEPTPGVGSATSFTDTSTGSDIIADPGNSIPQDNTTTIRPDRSLADVAPATMTADSGTNRSFLVVLAGFVLVLLIPIGLRRALRAWRLRPAHRSAVASWSELESTARDFGLFVTSSDTPRAFAGQLSQWPAMDLDALARMLEAVELERFGPPATRGGDIDDFRAVVGSLRRGASRGQWLRAFFLPRSMFGQATYASRPRTA